MHGVGWVQDLMKDDEKQKFSLAKCIDRVDSCCSNERLIPLYLWHCWWCHLHLKLILSRSESVLSDSSSNSKLFIYSLFLRLILIVYRPPPPNLMMAWKKMWPHSLGGTMAMSCTLTHWLAATWFTINWEDLGSFTESQALALAPATTLIWLFFTQKAAREPLKKMKKVSE